MKPNNSTAAHRPGELMRRYEQALIFDGVPARGIRERRNWVHAFIHFHYRKHPLELNEKHVRLFLIHMEYYKKYSLRERRTCTSAILYLYRHLLGQPDFHILDPEHPGLLYSWKNLML